MLSTSGGRSLATSLALLATVLLSSNSVLAGGADQQHGEQVISAGAKGSNQHNENTLTPPARRHLTDSEDASARDKRNQMYVCL